MAERVYHSARTWGGDLSHPPPLPNMERLPMLAALGADGSARFVDGSTVKAVHAVLYCTGYRYHYPFLERAGLLSTGALLSCAEGRLKARPSREGNGCKACGLLCAQTT